MPTTIDREQVQKLTAAGAQLVEVLQREEYVPLVRVRRRPRSM